MLNYLELKNVGIKPLLKLDVSPRLNILTGDNGLGKSFILDIMWFLVSGCFPAEINKRIQSGFVAKPLNNQDRAMIVANDGVDVEFFSYDYEKEYWDRHIDVDEPMKKTIFSDIAIYVMADGSYALWDRNLNRKMMHNKQIRYDGSFTYSNRPTAFVYTQEEIWQGLNDRNSNQFFNGLLQDWQIWQTGNTKEFQQLKSVLSVLSSQDELLEIGELKPFSLDDSRLYPTIKMPYGKSVLLPHCSSAIKRIVTLAYFLVYAWKRHLETAELLGKEPAKHFMLLIDEVEAHLHPKWQRKIVPALLSVLSPLSNELDIQLAIATHSPLVMASLEPIFEQKKDLWIDFDLNSQGEIDIIQREFEKQGNAENWLESEAFNLSSSRALEYEYLITAAKKLMRAEYPDKEEIIRLRYELVNALDPRDEFWTLWLIFCRKNGVL